MTSRVLSRKVVTIYFIAALAGSTACTAQNTLKNDPHTAFDTKCLVADQVLAVHLYGAWQVELSAIPSATDKAGTPAQPARASMVLAKNPDYDDSLGGWLELKQFTTRSLKNFSIKSSP